MNEAEMIDIEMDAARVCDAIARIGYSPAAAIMDIIDNAVTAGATRILIHIETVPERTYPAHNNVVRYSILDNGSGLSDDQVLKAFRLGAPANYRAKSLSKYGMGMKSAGLSLGSRIQVVSFQNMSWTKLNYIDRDTIGEAGKYVVCRADLPAGVKANLSGFLENSASGTAVIVEKCDGKNQTSAKKIIDQLQQQLGVVYYSFLSNPQGPLSITIKCTGKPDVHVRPFDILFLDKALKGFNPDTYTCKLPCLVLDEPISLTDNPSDQPVKLQVLLFPQSKMATNMKLTDEERLCIKNYMVKRDNKGFFVYRNNRLIRWGDDLDGLVGKDDIGFRARLLIETTHDDTLHVDVSKQRMAISDDLRNRIETLIRIPLRNAQTIFELCGQSFPKGEEGEEFNVRNQDLVEEDLDEPVGVSVDKVKKERRKKLEDATKKNLEEAGETPPEQPAEGVDQIPVFEKIRYSEKVKSIFLWEPGLDPIEGTFVRINQNHPFYQTVLARMELGAPARQALEALLWSCAAAENKVMQNLPELDAETISKVLERFKKVTGNTLDSWASKNQDLITND
jgi:hypothetical protein